MAAQVGCEAIVEVLQNAKADPSLQDKSGQTPLHRLAIYGKSKLLPLFMQHGGIVLDTADAQGRVPLHWAVRAGDAALVKSLLDNNASVDVQTVDGVPALHDAVRLGLLEITQVLLEKGANVELADQHGARALHVAARSAREDGPTAIVELLLSKNADVEARDRSRQLPAHLAQAAGAMKIADMLSGGGKLLPPPKGP